MGFFSEKSTMKNMMLFMLLSVTASGVTGEVYKVGDSSGWTAGSNSSYADWASSKTFHVNDVLLFEYNATNDNVILVSLSGYHTCNTSAPLKTYNSGNDSFTIKSKGHYYFTSNISGHCQGGQKLDVRVLHSSPPPKTITSPSPSVSHAAPAPMESKAPAPSPSESKAGSHDSKWLLMSTVGVTISCLVALVHGYA